MKSWVEISKNALLHNLGVFQKLVSKKTKIMCVVKANAYGHGLSEVVEILKGKADWFGVDSIDEALFIREVDKKTPILVLGFIPKERLKDTVENNVSFVAYDLDLLKYILGLHLKREARVHLKVETGLNRQGLKGNELFKLAKFIQMNSEYLALEGLYTHFANIEDTLDSSFAMQQLKNFNEEVNLLKKYGFNPIYRHSAATAGTMLFDSTHFNMVRVGIGLYGLWPSKETKISMNLFGKSVSLNPVMTWKSFVAQVKEISGGESVGYGRTWFAPRKTRVAIIPVGYSDGYDRGFSNSARVLIRGEFAPVIGRVAMNMIMVDVTDIKNARSGDEVVLLGKDGINEITADELAQRTGTINYEIVARINPLIPRTVVK